MKKIIVIPALIVFISLLISCGGEILKSQSVPVPDIFVNAVLDTLATIVTETTTIAKHREESNPIILSNVGNFELNIEKKIGVFYTVVFRSAAQQYEEQNNRCCFEIDIFTVASGKHPVGITASNNSINVKAKKLELSWNSSDPENDFLTYKIYLGTSANNMHLIQAQSEKHIL